MGETGIGHTRWATHGKPIEANAHPHMTDDVSVVHNGIIENFRELKAELMAEGAVFTSDTDTEVIAHLVTRELKAGNDPVRAVYHTLKRLEGAFALAMIFRGYNDLMIVARQGSPLAIGYRRRRDVRRLGRASRSRPSPTRSPISRTATGPC